MATPEEQHPTPGSPEPPAPTPSPTVIMFNQEQLDSRVAAARKEEKDKLYAEITKNKDRADQLAADIEKLKNAKPPETETETKTKDKRMKELQDKLESMESLLETQRADFPAALDKALSTAQANFQHSLEKERKEAEIKLHRTMLLRDNPEILEDFLVGDSVEQLNDSLEKAKAIYTKMREKIKMENPEPGTTPSGVSNPPSNPDSSKPPSSEGGGVSKISLQDMRNLTPAEFDAKKKAWLKAAVDGTHLRSRQ